jgi:hypothetical protein
MGAAQGVVEVDEVHNEEAVKGQAVGPPEVVVGPPASSLWVI